MKTFRLRKEYPGHKVGDMCFLNGDTYEWCTEPNEKIDKDIVEKYIDFFEEIVNGWKKRDIIFFINTDGEVIEENFLPTRHSNLVYFGNCFKTEEEAVWYRNQINKLISSKNNLVINKDEINHIIYNIENTDLAKTLLQKMI